MNRPKHWRNQIAYILILFSVLLTINTLSGAEPSRDSEPLYSFDSSPQIGIVAITSDSVRSRLVFLEENEDTLIQTPFPVQLDNIANVCIAEVTGDKKQDILVKQVSFSGEISSQIFFSENLGKGGWKPFQPFQLQPSEGKESQHEKLVLFDMSSGDIDLDGKSDLVFLLNSPAFDTNSVILYSLNKGKGRFSKPELFPIQDSLAYRLVIGDVTMDKKEDIVFVTNSGWENFSKGVRYFVTQAALWIIENKGHMVFEKPRGFIKLMNELKSFEDLSYNRELCKDEPYLIILYKYHSSFRRKDLGSLVFINSDHCVVIPTLHKTDITWPSGVTRKYSYYRKSTPWEFYPGREGSILVPFW